MSLSGAQRRDKAANVANSRNLWVPAVIARGEFGRWDSLEVTDPWDAQNTIRAHLDATAAASA